MGIERQARDFPGGSEVNLPASAGDEGSIPGRGTNISHAEGRLRWCATTGEKPASVAIKSPRVWSVATKT